MVGKFECMLIHLRQLHVAILEGCAGDEENHRGK